MNPTKLKLTNPTDDELSAAVAEHVAGYTMHLAPGCEWRRKEIPPFARSADKVLPLLEKCNVVSINWILPDEGNSGWRVDIYESIESAARLQGKGALDRVFARAGSIALLRANGIEVEVTP